MPNVNKRFKEWERKFSKEDIKKCRDFWLPEGTKLEDIMAITKWPYPVNQWIQSAVQYAVYDAPDADMWQRFRVSLKGLTTYEKLYCLNKYYKTFVEGNKGKIYEHRERCRVDNYLGALVRGGQLNPNLEIIR